MKFTHLAILWFCLLTHYSAKGQIVSNFNVLNQEQHLGFSYFTMFNVNMITDCDTFNIDTNIDYLEREVNINIAYNLIDSCNLTTNQKTEFLTIYSPVLTGEYIVKVNVTVIQNSELNETTIGQTINVSFHNPQCNDNKEPSQICPTIIEPVCSCEGVQYDNQCIAYFHHGTAVSNILTCSEMIEQKIAGNICTELNSTEDGHFQTYPCLEVDDTFMQLVDCPGDELAITYTRNESTTYLEYIANKPIVALIAETDNTGNLRCLPLNTSTGSSIDVSQLQVGKEYIIIIDSETSGPISINACQPVTSSSSNISVGKPYNLVQTANATFLTANKALTFELFNTSGSRVQRGDISKGEEIELIGQHNIYVLLTHADGDTYSQKILLY